MIARSAAVTPPSSDAAPSTRWYRLASVVALVGVIGAFAWWPYAATRVHDAVYAFDRIGRFGGRVAMEAGTHTFWLEGDCMSCEGNDPEEYRAVDTLVIRAEESGGPVVVRPSPNDWLYNTGSREGRALYVLEVPRAGLFAVRYDLDTSSPKWENRAPAALAFGHGAGLPVRIIRPMALLAGGGLGLASALSLVTFWRRRRFYDRRYAAHDR